MSDHQSAHPTIDSELDRKLAALWFMHYGDANPKAAATAIIQLKDLIAQEANKARIEEIKWALSRTSMDELKERYNALTADKESNMSDLEGGMIGSTPAHLAKWGGAADTSKGQPNPKDPQAELREAIVIKLNSMFGQNYVETDEGTLFTTEIADDLVALFQAHQQELLSELLGELPEKELPEVKPGAMIIEHEGKLIKTEHLAKMRNTGFNEAIDQVVEMLNRKIGELNG